MFQPDVQNKSQDIMFKSKFRKDKIRPQNVAIKFVYKINVSQKAKNN